MHEVLLIARREYLERVRSRAFLMMTILFPVFIGLMIGGSIFAGKLSSGVKEIAIASNDAVLAREVAAEMQIGFSRRQAAGSGNARVGGAARKSEPARGEQSARRLSVAGTGGGRRDSAR